MIQERELPGPYVCQNHFQLFKEFVNVSETGAGPNLVRTSSLPFSWCKIIGLCTKCLSSQQLTVL